MTDIETTTEAVPQPHRHPDGIYFGLDEKEYHADDALGSSSLKELVVDPIEYQHRRLHGGERKETIELRWGRAIHCRVLEGASSFRDRFLIAPTLTDYPKALDTMPQLRKYCDEIGIKADKTKAETIKRIREVDKEVLIWDEIQAEFAIESAGRDVIPAEAVEHIERAAKWMQRDRKLADAMEDGTFTSGASEVSIFYTDPTTKVRLKARIDHLLSHGAIDLKSFRPIMAEQLESAAKRAIGKMRYDLQYAAYWRALRHALFLYRDGKVYNCHYDPAFLESVFTTVANGNFKWIWVLIKASGAPQPVVAEFLTQSFIAKAACEKIDAAIKDYARYCEQFGLDSDWVPDRPADVWGDEDFPPWMFQ